MSDTFSHLIASLCALQWHAVRLYGVADALYRRGHPMMAMVISTVNRIVCGVDIAPGASIGSGLVIVHGHGLVVHPGTVIGDGCVLFQNVTLGERGRGDHRAPTVGNEVTIYPGAVVVGPVHVGDGAQIGPNCVVSRDVAPGAVVKAPRSEIYSPG